MTNLDFTALPVGALVARTSDGWRYCKTARDHWTAVSYHGASTPNDVDTDSQMAWQQQHGEAFARLDDAAVTGVPTKPTAYDLADYNAEFQQAWRDLAEGLGDEALTEETIQVRAVRAHRARRALTDAMAASRAASR